MTPDQQKLIDAAAEQQYEEDRKRHVNTRSTWPKWKDAPDDVKDPYRSAVTIPVTVALRAAVEVVRPKNDDPRCDCIEIKDGKAACSCYCSNRDDGEYSAAWCEEFNNAAAISSLIPAQEKTSEA